jgi:hypothetical protein
MRHHGAEDHGAAEDDQNGAVALGGGLAGRGRPRFVVGAKDLDEDGAELAGGGADAVAQGAVAGWEHFGGDDVGGCVGAYRVGAFLLVSAGSVLFGGKAGGG